MRLMAEWAPALLPGCSPRPQRILPEQRLLEDEQQCRAVLAYLPNDASERRLGAPLPLTSQHVCRLAGLTHGCTHKLQLCAPLPPP